MATLHLDDDLVAVMRLVDEPLDRFAREAIVLGLHRRGSISSGKAAELMGMDRLTYIRYAGERGIPYIDMTPEEWAAEMNSLDDMRSRNDKHEHD
jgi:hypothetical protein